MRKLFAGLCALAALLGSATVRARDITVERPTIHSASLEGNLEGNSPDRKLIVFLPPSYGTAKQRRYPVVYALHGYSIDNEKWITEIDMPGSMAKALAAGAREMIVVIPDAKTRHNGSMYSSSVTTGDWEGFVARDLVSYMDSHYRTIPDRMSRGLAGHSMGGYGTVRIAMKHPEVFSSFYAMSACCMAPRTIPAEMGKRLETLTPEEAANGDFMTRATLAVAAAWSPNPKKPPFFVDLPTKDGAIQPDVIARWAANAPLAMVDQYVPALRRYHAIALDVGDKDGLAGDMRTLDAILTRYGLAHSFEIYDGDHVNHVADRFAGFVLPFFSKNLAFSR